MSTTACQSCGFHVVSGVGFCPHCGANQYRRADSRVQGDPYEILQVARNADQAVIEAAYKSLAKKFHPDSSSGHANQEMMKELNWAYEILGDATRRKRWDLDNRSGPQVPPQSARASTAAPSAGPSPRESPRSTGRDSGTGAGGPTAAKKPEEKVVTVADDPSVLKSFGFMALILVSLYAGAFMVGVILADDPGTASILLTMYTLGSRAIVAYKGAEGRSRLPVSLLRFLGTLLLSLIPLVSWLVAYWAGKSYARKYPALSPLVPFAVAAVPITIGILLLSGSSNLLGTLSAPQLPALLPAAATQRPTSAPTRLPPTRVPTIRPIATVKIAVTYRGTTCVPWTSVDASDLESIMCVYGRIYTYGPYSNRWDTIQFSPSPSSFRVRDFNYYYVEPLNLGDCAVVYGRVRDYGSYLMITPDKDAADSVRTFPPSFCG